MARTPHGYHDPVRIRGDLTAAGFRDIAIDLVTSAVPPLRLRMSRSPPAQGTPMRGEIEAQGPAESSKLQQSAAEELARASATAPSTERSKHRVISAA